MFLLTNKTIEKLQYDLVREGLINIDGLMKAQEKAKTQGTKLAQELINANLITENILLKFIEDKLHIPFVDLNDYSPDVNCLKLVDFQDAKKYNIFPLFKIEDVLTVAMIDPLDLFSINNIFANAKITIEPVLCTEQSIQKAINKYYTALDTSKNTNWQEILLTDNINDDVLNSTITNIIQDAISKQYEYILMERTQTGLSIFFNKELQGFIPNILVQRFLEEFKNITNIQEDINEIAQNSKIIINNHSIIISVFPTKFSTRIMININKPIKSIDEYNINKKQLNELTKSPILIGIKTTNETSLFMYSLAEYFSSKGNVLIVENQSKYELNTISQIEFNENIAINFDKLITQIEFQKFDIIFWEKIYTQAQIKKLKLLAKEKIIFVGVLDDNLNDCEFILNTNGQIN